MKNNLKIENIALTEGLPCHKFILQALTSLNGAKTFTKNYVTTMVQYGMTHNDIATSLLFLSARTGQLNGAYRFDQWDSHTEGFDLVDDILMDNTVVLYKSCRQYYKTFDTKCTACALCPMARSYKNKWEESERQIIRYCLESQQNLDYIISKGIDADSFVAVVDVTARKTAAAKPCLYPFYKRTFEALITGTWATDIFVEGMDYDIVLEKYHSTRLEKIHSIVKDCSVSLTTFCAVMISEQLPETSCSREEIDCILKKMQSDENGNNTLASLFESPEKDGVSLSKCCNLGMEQLADFYNAENPGKKKAKRKKDSSKTKYSTPTASPIPSNPSFVEISLTDIVNGLYNSDYNTNESATKESSCVDITAEINESTASRPARKVPAESNRDNSPDALFPAMYRKGSLSTSISDSVTETESAKSVIRIHEIPQEDNEYYIEENSLVSIPLVDKKELSHFSLDLDIGNSMLLTLFESYILKDKRLSIELVYVEGNYYLLFYSPKMHAYFHSSCRRRDVKEIIAMLLSYSSIEKYCYSPYVLSSIARQLDIRIKSLWSIYSMSEILYKNHRMPMESVLLEMGAVKAEGGVTLRAEGNIKSSALAYMHCYHNIFHRTKKKFLKMGVYNEYEEQNTFDIVLGMSYYQSHYCKTSAFLFQLKGASNYVFHSKIPSDYKVAGNAYCIYFRHSPTQSSYVIIWLLRELYQCGMFHNCEIMIQSMGENFFTYFVPAEHADYVDLRINRMLLKHIKGNGLHGMEYSKTEIKDCLAYPEHFN